MKFHNLHPWDISITQAKHLQDEPRDKINYKNSVNLDDIETIAACDASFKGGYTTGAVCVFLYPLLAILETVSCKSKIRFPCIPGLLSFREGPILIKCFKRIKKEPDVIIFDGQGIAHPKRMGIATHLGIILDRPTIGCAKGSLFSKPSKTICALVFEFHLRYFICSSICR